MISAWNFYYNLKNILVLNQTLILVVMKIDNRYVLQ